MHTILVTPATQWFSSRLQWRFQIRAGNNKKLSDRDTYANVGDIEDAFTDLVAGPGPVFLEVHYRNGIVDKKQLR